MSTASHGVARAIPRTARARVSDTETVELRDGWEACSTAPGAQLDALDLARLAWSPARVPGAAADVLRARGASAQEVVGARLDDEDWWFRTRFAAQPEHAGGTTLIFDGLASVTEVYLNGELILESDSMFERHHVAVGAALRAENELVVCARALVPRLRVSRRPRARWRTRLVTEGNLRFQRTMLIGRTPGFAGGPAVVGPYRAVALEHAGALVIERLELRPRVDDGAGMLAVALDLCSLEEPAPERVTLELERGGHRWRTELTLSSIDGPLRRSAHAELRVPDVELWWPHTHGEPARYHVGFQIIAGHREIAVDAGHVGFRSLRAPRDVAADGLALELNGVDVFARGAVWTPFDIASAEAVAATEVRAALIAMRNAGMNIVRLPGTGAYETSAFHDACDELGMLVWQDCMFANLDYPAADPQFMATVEREIRQLLDQLAGRPSVVVLCGSSEVDQQVAMLGLDPALARGALFGELLPDLIAASGIDAIYVPSTPSGAGRAFRPDRGVASYFGVGGYRRPLEDARRADVRFAGECLAIANVPDEEALAAIFGDGAPIPAVHDPRWKAGVPRDLGAGWDFDDVRDHYLQALFSCDPVELRRVDVDRYLELSREVSGELLAAVLGEWRRRRSLCAGAIVLWLRDLQPGAGWGLLDHRGAPKVAYHHLRRTLAPTAVWSTDEGLAGLAAHVANDGAEQLAARLRVALYRDWELCVEEASTAVELPPHGSLELDVEELIGRFVDVSWAYRFGPPGHDVVVLSLERDGGLNELELISQSFYMPAARPLARESAERLGLSAEIVELGDGSHAVSITARRFTYCVRLDIPGYLPRDDAFSVEPGRERTITLEPAGVQEQPPTRGSLRALNLAGSVSLRVLVPA